MNCRTSTHTGALGTEKETRHKSHAMGECLKHLARKQKQMGVKSAKTICMLSIGDSPSDQRPGPKERKATTAAILAQGTRHTYTARFRMCSHGRSKTDSRSPKDPKCPVIRLGIPKPTSGHQQVTPSRCPEVGLGNLDSTSERSQKVKSRKRKPTSGHQERPAKVVDRKKRRRQNEDANNDFEHIQTMQNHCVFIGFKHITTFEAISTTTTVNGTGARSTFHKFT